MRRLSLILVLTALIVPSAAFALPGSDGYGSLAVTGGSGTVVIQGKGVVFGHLDTGSLIVVEYRPVDPNNAVSVSGANAAEGSGVTTYTGTDVRFLVPAGRYTVELVGSGIDLSAIGRGTVGATADPAVSGGFVALDGGKSVPLGKVDGPQSFGAGVGQPPAAKGP